MRLIVKLRSTALGSSLLAAVVVCGSTDSARAAPSDAPTADHGMGVVAFAGVGAGARLLGNVDDRLGPLGYESMSKLALRPEVGLRLEPPTGPAVCLNYDLFFSEDADNANADTDIHIKLEHLVIRFEMPLRDSGWRLYPGLGIGFGRALVRREGPHFDSFEEVANGSEGTAAMSSYEVLLNAAITGGYLVQLGPARPGWRKGLFLGLHAGVISALSNGWRDGHKPGGLLLPAYYMGDHENTLFDEDEVADTLRVGPVRPYLGLVVGMGSSPAAD